MTTRVPAIEYVAAHKSYEVQNKKVLALEPLTLRIEQGEFFGLLGHNGAGKSTAINMLCGVVRPSGGQVKVLGIDVEKEQKESKRFLGVVPQEIYADSFFRLDLMLKIQSKLSGVVPDAEWIDFLLTRLALKNHVGKTTRELSGGMKRRMMIARALVHKPKIIVLDEPTAGVDVELRHSMWEFVQELNKLGNTIILTTHYLEEAEQFCSRLAILKSGKLLTVKRNQEVLELGGKPKILFFLNADVSRFEEMKKNLAHELGEVSIGAHIAQKEVFLECHFDPQAPASLVDASAKLQHIVSANGLEVTRIGTEQPTLEQVFLQLTR